MAASSTSFAAGNLAALKGGARSPRIVAARTQAIVDEWSADETLSHILAPADTAALYAVAAAYARLAELTEYLEADDSSGKPRGSLDSRGRPRGCMRLYFSALREVMSGLRQLGLTPSGRAEMATGAAVGLMGARRAVEAQERLRVAHAADVGRDPQ